MAVPTDTWTTGDTEIIARAVIEAPSIHDTQPWNLRLPGRSAELDERLEFAEPGLDPLRPDRLISCGTALANLELGMRVLGWRTRTTLLPDPERPEMIARVDAVEVRPPRRARIYGSMRRSRTAAVTASRSRGFPWRQRPSRT